MATKKKAKKTAKKTAKKVTKKVGKKAAKKAAKKVVRKAAKKAAKKVAKKVVRRAAKKVTKKAAKKAGKKVTKKVAKKTSKKTAKKVTKKAAKSTAKKTTKKTAKKTTAKAVAPAKRTPPKETPDLTGAAVKKALGGGANRSVAAVATITEPDAKGYAIINGRRVRIISTAGLDLPKKKSSATKKVEAPVVLKSAPKVKTKLTAKELRAYKALLLTKRAQLLGLLDGIQNEALRSNGGNLSNMPLHMADIGTDTFDQDLALGMAETERKLLEEIYAALSRIADKTYGVCQMTKRAIPKARLEAKPWARYTVKAARMVETGMHQ